jgi:hypothetical protein
VTGVQTCALPILALNNLRKIYDNTLNIEQVQLDDLETALPKDFELSGETNTNYLKNICKERIN